MVSAYEAYVIHYASFSQHFLTSLFTVSGAAAASLAQGNGKQRDVKQNLHDSFLLNDSPENLLAG